VVRLLAHGDSIVYLRKGDFIVEHPESLSGLIDLKKCHFAHHRSDDCDFSFEDWTASTSTFTNLWSFNSTIPVHVEQLWILEHNEVLRVHVQRL